MKSPIVLWNFIADDMAMLCPASTDRDKETVAARYEHEGFSFLTITLTDFGKDFERCLALGRVDSSAFRSFGRRRGLPAFLRGFLSLVFDDASGLILDRVNHDAVFAVRQLTLAFGKVLVPCSDARNRAALRSFLDLENELSEVVLPSVKSFWHLDRHTGESRQRLGESHGEHLASTWRTLFGDIFNHLEADLLNNNFERFVPKHGPGATADKLVGNQKYKLSHWHERLEKVLPHGDFIVPNWRYSSGTLTELVSPEHEPPVRVVLVPKTLKTPRVIAIEPTAMQFAQQAVANAIIHGINEDDFLVNTVGFVDPRRDAKSSHGYGQFQNQELARIGSIDGKLSTIDLSEASDRVLNWLVEELFKPWPLLQGVIAATRSTRADVDGQVINLTKYASMGSALTFPIESMVFSAIVLDSIKRQRENQYNSRVRSLDLIGSVRIYGDDIIVPTDYAVAVMADLESFGFKVNASKSFWTGRFRESCGKEYFEGTDVSISRVRRLFPTSRQDVPEVESLVSLRNQLYNAGLWKTAAGLDETIRSLLTFFPIVLPTSVGLGRTSVFGYQAERNCAKLHRPLVKAYVIRPVIPINELDGQGALLKWFLSGPQEDPRHLERSGRPRSVNMKPRMVCPF